MRMNVRNRNEKTINLLNQKAFGSNHCLLKAIKEDKSIVNATYFLSK